MLREKRELVPTVPGLEEEEGEKAGTGRGKHPATPVLCDAMGVVTNPTSALHPSPGAGCSTVPPHTP